MEVWVENFEIAFMVAILAGLVYALVWIRKKRKKNNGQAGKTGLAHRKREQGETGSKANTSETFSWKDIPLGGRIAIHGFAIALFVWFIVEALVTGTIRMSESSGRYVSFEEDPIFFLLELGFVFFVLGWLISPLLRAVVSKINHYWK